MCSSFYSANPTENNILKKFSELFTICWAKYSLPAVVKMNVSCLFYVQQLIQSAFSPTKNGNISTGIYYSFFFLMCTH